MNAQRYTRKIAAGWVVDTFVEPGRRDEDRVSVQLAEDGLAFVLADGAGNSGRGRAAAEHAVASHIDEDPVAMITRLDRALFALGAEAAIIAGSMRFGAAIDLRAALAGDARLWARRAGDWSALGDGVPRKPLVGSGAAATTRIARDVDAVLCASDGLAAWSGPELDGDLLAHDDAVFRLADRVRLQSGALGDDLSIVWIRRAT